MEPSSCLTSPYVGVGGPTIARSRSTPQGVHRAPAVAPYRRLHGTMCVKPSCLGCIDRSVPCMSASRDSVWPSEPLSIPNGATCLPSLVLTPWHATLSVWIDYDYQFTMWGRKYLLNFRLSKQSCQTSICNQSTKFFNLICFLSEYHYTKPLIKNNYALAPRLLVPCP